MAPDKSSVSIDDVAMLEIPQFVVDAFTKTLFGGNPAAVCLLKRWPADAVLQSIAAENNLSETAFLLADVDPTPIRWFTPATEVDICGHATLASGFVLLEHVRRGHDSVRFASRKFGELTVTKTTDGKLELDFPQMPPVPVADASEREQVGDALDVALSALYAVGEFYLAELADEDSVRRLAPDMRAVAALEKNPIVTARADADEIDFVSRFFAPADGIDEDPVTGSAHCVLAPFWASRLGKETLRARQLSKRGGDLHCAIRGDRVAIAGDAVLYARGTIIVPD